jgi:hypothetical protein
VEARLWLERAITQGIRKLNLISRSWLDNCSRAEPICPDGSGPKARNGYRDRDWETRAGMRGKASISMSPRWPIGSALAQATLKPLVSLIRTHVFAAERIHADVCGLTSVTIAHSEDPLRRPPSSPIRRTEAPSIPSNILQTIVV